MTKTYKNITYNPDTGELHKDGNLCVGQCSGGYIILSIEGVAVRAHRLAWFMMTGQIAKVVDHKNGVRLDNRWSNLRNVTHSQNSLNRNSPILAKSGMRGIRKRGTKWEGRIMVNYKERSKMFDTLEDAISWRSNELERHS